MKSTKEEIADYLQEVQAIVDAVERRGRTMTRDEKARAEFLLERVKSLKDTQSLTKAIGEMNGSLTRAAVVVAGWRRWARRAFSPPCSPFESICAECPFAPAGSPHSLRGSDGTPEANPSGLRGVARTYAPIEPHACSPSLLPSRAEATKKRPPRRAVPHFHLTM